MTQPPGAPTVSNGKPFAEIGRRIGRLLQESSDAADELKRTAESESELILAEARRALSETIEEAANLVRGAETEAASIVEQARSVASRLSEQSAHDKRLADAEAAVERREAHRRAKLIVDMAHRQAEEIVETATGRAAEQARALENRIRQLQVAETELQVRIQRLEDLRTSMELEKAERLSD